MSTTTITAAEDAPVRSSAAIAAGEQQPWDWHWRNIKWSLVLRAQHWGVIFLIVIAAAVSGGAHYTLQHNPRIRPALAYDATISYPTVAQVAVPDSQAALWPWLAFLVSLFVTEGLLFRGRHSATTAMAAFLHFGVACFANFLIIVAVSEVTKPWAGRLRPDFLDRCRPVDLGGSQPSGGGNFTRSVGTINLFQVSSQCTSTNYEAINDGRLSFPSGHACNTMSVAWFSGLYSIWSLHIREGSPVLAHHVRSISGEHRGRWLGRALREVLIALANAWILFSLLIGWFIGISRLWDNRHHISDILGGFLLSMLLGTFQAIKAVGQYAVIKAQLDAASKGQRRQSPPALPVAAAGPRNAAGPASPPFNGNGQLAGGGAGRNGVGAGMQMGRLPQGGPAAPPAGPYSA